MGIEPIVRQLAPLRHWPAHAFYWFRTRGLHPSHPDHARIAIKRAQRAGGVRH